MDAVTSNTALVSALVGVIVSLIAAAIPQYNDLSGERKSAIMIVFSLIVAVALDLYKNGTIQLDTVITYLLTFAAANQTAARLVKPWVETAQEKRLAARLSKIQLPK